MAVLSVAAAQTQTVRVAPDVANLPLRPPAVLARSVATLDLLSGGRVELGLGAGAFYDAIAALGGPRLTAGKAIRALSEAIDVIRTVWDTGAGSLRIEGEHYRVKGAHPGPAPAHDVEIWLGAYKPRMLALTGAKADGWLPSQSYAGPEALSAMNAAIDEAAAAAGRRQADVRRLYNVGGRFGSGSGFLGGPPSAWVEQLGELALTQGMSTFIVVGDDPDFVRRFAAEDRSVFPHLRRSDAQLAPVIDRLEEEHHVIAGVIEQVDRALVALVTEPDGIVAVQAAVDLPTDTMRSHPSYEERDLVEPLARLGYY